MSRSSVIVLWSWQLLQRGCQFFSSRNKSGSPRCGLIWYTTVAGTSRPFSLHRTHPGGTLQEKPPGFLPLSPVATQHRVLPFALALLFMFVTIFFPIRHQPWASRILARCLRSSWHSYHLRNQKRTDDFQASVLHFFLTNYSISYRSQWHQVLF